MKNSTLPSSPPTLEPPTSKALEAKPAAKESTEWLESLTRLEQEPSKVVKSASLQNQSARGRQRGVWGVFSSTFLTIFLAEMGDKTQLATLLMSAESQSPWIVFAGSGAALIATSLVGVLLGRWLAKCVSPKTLEASAATLLLFISVLLLCDVVNF